MSPRHCLLPLQNLMGNVNASLAKLQRKGCRHDGTHHRNQPAASLDAANDPHHAVSGILANHDLINVKLWYASQIHTFHHNTPLALNRITRRDIGDNVAVRQEKEIANSRQKLLSLTRANDWLWTVTPPQQGVI
jgi:hypothetical protein